MSTILDKIVETKRTEIEQAKAARPLEALQHASQTADTPRDFYGALADYPPVRLIAEIKKASPSRGVIREDFSPVEIAKIYESHGASCISVLTDETYFQGSLEYLRDVREAVSLPVLRKDFIIEPYQVWEARAAGADAVLLIAECLDDESLHTLFHLVTELGMTPLVEMYDPANLPRMVEVGAKLVGINNRDLTSFYTDLEHTLRLKECIPDDRIVVSESGILSRADVLRLESSGIGAILVGEGLMSQADIGKAVDELLGKERSE